jgi:hypothetical protein
MPSATAIRVERIMMVVLLTSCRIHLHLDFSSAYHKGICLPDFNPIRIGILCQLC